MDPVLDVEVFTEVGSELEADPSGSVRDQMNSSREATGER
jgi:hypothetical protein